MAAICNMEIERGQFWTQNEMIWGVGDIYHIISKFGSRKLIYCNFQLLQIIFPESKLKKWSLVSCRSSFAQKLCVCDANWQNISTFHYYHTPMENVSKWRVELNWAEYRSLLSSLLIIVGAMYLLTTRICPPAAWCGRGKMTSPMTAPAGLSALGRARLVSTGERWATLHRCRPKAGNAHNKVSGLVSTQLVYTNSQSVH